MTLQIAIFWVLALGIGLSAIIATFARNIVNSAYALFFTLLGLAGIYILLGADFLAVTQVVVYVGGILVLLLFGVLLTNRRVEDLLSSGKSPYALGILAGVAVFTIITGIFQRAHWPEALRPLPEATTRPLGYMLLQNYLLPFEFASITLLAALIGAAYIVRPKERD